MKWEKKCLKDVTGSQMWKPWPSSTKTIYATNPSESKKWNPILVFYRPPVFHIPTQEKNIKCTKEYVQVVTGFQMWKPWPLSTIQFMELI